MGQTDPRGAKPAAWDRVVCPDRLPASVRLRLFRFTGYDVRIGFGELESKNPLPAGRAFNWGEFPLPRRFERELAEVWRETMLHRGLRYIPRWIHGNADDHRRFPA